MGEIRQNGEITLHSDDGTNIRVIFKNLTGGGLQSQEYTGHTRHIIIGEMGFSSGIIEHCRDGEVIGKGKIPNVWKAENPMKLRLHRIFICQTLLMLRNVQ